LIATRARAEPSIVLRPHLSMAREKNVSNDGTTRRHALHPGVMRKTLLADQAAG
jgi:hypothetical protein